MFQRVEWVEFAHLVPVIIKNQLILWRAMNWTNARISTFGSSLFLGSEASGEKLWHASGDAMLFEIYNMNRVSQIEGKEIKCILYVAYNC